MGKECKDEMPPGTIPRMIVSMVVGIGWLIFLIIFLWFYAADLGIFKSIAVFLISILVVGAILGPMWAFWGVKTAHNWERRKVRRQKRR